MNRNVGYFISIFSTMYCASYLFSVMSDMKDCDIEDALFWIWMMVYFCMLFVNIILLLRLQKNDPIFIIFWLACTLVLVLYRFFGRECTDHSKLYTAIKVFLNFLILISMGVMVIVYKNMIKNNANLPRTRTEPVRSSPYRSQWSYGGARSHRSNDYTDRHIIDDYSENQESNPVIGFNLPDIDLPDIDLPEASAPEASNNTPDNPPDYCTAMRNSMRAEDCCHNESNGADCGGTDSGGGDCGSGGDSGGGYDGGDCGGGDSGGGDCGGCDD